MLRSRSSGCDRACGLWKHGERVGERLSDSLSFGSERHLELIFHDQYVLEWCNAHHGRIDTVGNEDRARFGGTSRWGGELHGSIERGTCVRRSTVFGRFRRVQRDLHARRLHGCVLQGISTRVPLPVPRVDFQRGHRRSHPGPRHRSAAFDQGSEEFRRGSFRKQLTYQGPQVGPTGCGRGTFNPGENTGSGIRSR